MHNIGTAPSFGVSAPQLAAAAEGEPEAGALFGRMRDALGASRAFLQSCFGALLPPNPAWHPAQCALFGRMRDALGAPRAIFQLLALIKFPGASRAAQGARCLRGGRRIPGLLR